MMATPGFGQVSRYLALLTASLAFAAISKAAQVVPASKVLSKSYSLIPKTPIIPPNSASPRVRPAFRPSFNRGGPCVVPGGGNATVSYTGNDFSEADRTISASSLKLNGKTCGSGNGAAVWKLIEGRPDIDSFRDAGRAFRFFATTTLDPSRSLFQWLYATVDSSDGPVFCGEGQGVRRLLWLKTPEKVPKKSILRRRGGPAPPPGGILLIVDALDADGSSWTCVFSEREHEKKKNGGAGNAEKAGNTEEGEKVEEIEKTAKGEKASVKEGDGGAGLGSGEIAGIAAGCAGTVVALVVVISASVLWRRQRVPEGETD